MAIDARLLEACDLECLTRLINFDWLVERSFVAPSPRRALWYIESIYGHVPDRLGTNCLGLAQLRSVIADIAGDNGEAFANALLLVAPHTHWAPAPIIQTFERDQGKYLVGVQDGVPPFHAVSFAFGEAGPFPFEWSDSTCKVQKSDLKTIWQFISVLNQRVVSSSWYREPFPFGVSINHRFKSPFDPPAFSTHESPAPDPSVLSCIVRTSSGKALNDTHFDQVGWSAATPPELSEDELEVIDTLEKHLECLSTEEASEVIKYLVELEACSDRES